MERDRKKVDKFFASNLEGFKTEPSKQVWLGIEKKYFGRGAGFISLFWRILPFVLVIGSGIAIYSIIFLPDGKDISVIEPIAKQEQASTTQHSIEEPITEPVPEEPEKQDLNNTSSLAPSIIHPAQPVTSIIDNEITLSQQDNINPMQSIGCAYLDQSSSIMIEPAGGSKHALNEVSLGLSVNNDYIRKSEYWFGAHLTPAVMYYPEKSNKNSWSGELTFDYVPSRFTFQGGIGLGYYEEPGEYQVAFSRYDSIGFYYDVSSFSVHPQNPDSVMFEVTEVSIYDSVDHIVINEIENKYLYLRFPVNVGYEIFNTNKFSFYARAGLVFSVLVWKDEPEVILPANDIDLISIEQTYPGRISTSLQFTVGASFIYQFSKKAGLTLEPMYMRYIGSLYKQGFDYSDTRPYSIGLRTGIYVKF